MNILVVDDEVDTEPFFQQCFRKEIRGGGLQFAFIHSGQEALSYLPEQSNKEMLILSDINVPGMTGLNCPKEFGLFLLRLLP